MTQLPDVEIAESGPVMYVGKRYKHARQWQVVKSERVACEGCGRSFWRWEDTYEPYCALCLSRVGPPGL